MKNKKRRPGGGGADLCLAAGDRQQLYKSTAESATILGVSPDRPGRVRVWLWSEAGSVQVLGSFWPQAVPAIAERLQRNRPDLQVFVAAGVML